MRKASFAFGPLALVVCLGLFGLANGCGKLKPAATPDGGAGSGGAAGGSGGTTGSGGSGHVLVTVSGAIAPHPLEALVAAMSTGGTDGGTGDAATSDGAADASSDASSDLASHAEATDATVSDGASDATTDASSDGATDATTDASSDASSDGATAGFMFPASFSMLKVAIVDPTAVIADPNAAPLASAALNTSSTNCTAAGCGFSLTGVDITNLTLGLVGTVEDTRTGADRIWVKTGTGMGTANFLKGVRAAPAPITDRRGFIVSRKLEAALGVFLGQALGTTFAPGDLETRGFLIGHVLDKLSTATTPAGPAGVAGATVMAQGMFDVVYPKADFSGVGTSTSSNGIFLMVPKLVNGAAVSVVANWTVVPPTGDARTWEAHLAGTNPGNAFVIIMPANE